MGTMDVLSLLLTLLATSRITRLVTDDMITERPRTWVLSKLHPDHLPAYLVTCPWCVSVYAGAAAGTAWWAWGDTRVFTAAVGALAASYVAGFLAQLTATPVAEEE